MLINDIITMLQAIPRILAVGWVAWFALGLALSIWSRREKLGAYAYASPDDQPAPRAKSGPRPSARAAVKSVPQSSGDAFGDLEQIFNDVQGGAHRLPGEVPAAVPPPPPAVSGPVRNAPVLAAPQSLP